MSILNLRSCLKFDYLPCLRAVALFAMALQNFEKKLKSAAEKKSSEIIASVSEEIHLELENVKSHIITEAYVCRICSVLLLLNNQSMILLIMVQGKDE